MAEKIPDKQPNSEPENIPEPDAVTEEEQAADKFLPKPDKIKNEQDDEFSPKNWPAGF